MIAGFGWAHGWRHHHLSKGLWTCTRCGFLSFGSILYKISSCYLVVNSRNWYRQVLLNLFIFDFLFQPNICYCCTRPKLLKRNLSSLAGAFAHSVPYKNLLASSSQPPAPLPITAPDFYRDLYYRVDVIFHDKAIPNDPGFTLPLSYRNMYDDMARAVGAHLNCDPYMIQFFKPQGMRI